MIIHQKKESLLWVLLRFGIGWRVGCGTSKNLMNHRVENTDCSTASRLVVRLAVSFPSIELRDLECLATGGQLRVD